jgi:hypothetical protein
MEAVLVAFTTADCGELVKAATARVGVVVEKARAAVASPMKEWLPLAPSCEPWMSVQVRPPSVERSRPSP